MDFEISHSLPATVTEVATALLDRRFQESLANVSSALKAREILSQEQHTDGKVARSVRSVLAVDLGPARPFIGDGEPAWVEAALWDPDEMTWTWEVHPEVGAQLLSASGSITLTDDAGGTERTVRGDVRVRVPVYGGRVEALIVEHLERAYEEEARLLHDWLAPAPKT